MTAHGALNVLQVMTDDFELPGQARSPLKQSGLPQANTERVTYSPDRQTPRLNSAKGEDEELHEVQDNRKPESTGHCRCGSYFAMSDFVQFCVSGKERQIPSCAAGEHVPTSHPHENASSARRERPTSARRREPASPQLSPGKEKIETASRWQVC